MCSPGIPGLFCASARAFSEARPLTRNPPIRRPGLLHRQKPTKSLGWAGKQAQPAGYNKKGLRIDHWKPYHICS